MTRPQKLLDTRDLIKERDELKGVIVAEFNEKFNTNASDFDDVKTLMRDLYKDDREEFRNEMDPEFYRVQQIDELEREMSREFIYGVTMIHEDYFEEYARDLVQDCGDIPRTLPRWIVVDWSATASNLQDDYSETLFDGETYYYRD